MIDSLLQSKLAGFLNEIFECKQFKIFSLSEMGFSNFKIKPKFVQDLSQKIKIPLQLVSGQIGSLKLNKPWQKLFFLNSPVKIQIQDMKLKTKISNSFSQAYLLRRKAEQIQNLTELLFNPLQSIKNLNLNINKRIKEFFLNKIHFELKNFVMQIQVDLKQRISIIVKYDSLIYKKCQEKQKQNKRIDCQVTNLRVYYKVGNDKEIQLMLPTNVELSRIKTKINNQKKSFKIMKIQDLQFNINNMNYGDTARIFLLIKWHNTFKDIPYSLWKFKPFILSQCKPYQKFIYIAKLIHNEFVQSNFKKQLKLRREYLNIYKKILSQEQVQQQTAQLKKIQKFMPLWKIMAYRSYCLNLMRSQLQKKRLQQKKKHQQSQNINLPQKQFNLNSLFKGGSWFKNLFAAQKNKEQLQQQFLNKVNTFQDIPNDIQSIVSIHISKIRCKLSIVSNFGLQPFISIIGIDCSFRFTQNLLERRWQAQFSIVKYKVEYERYLGHYERYRNFISQCKQHLNIQQKIDKINEAQHEDQQIDEQFDQIQSFFKVQFQNYTTIIEINILPFDLYLNYEVIQKFSILLNIEKLAKITRMEKYQDIYISKYDAAKFADEEKSKIITLRYSKQKQQLLSPFKFIKAKGESSSPIKTQKYIDSNKNARLNEDQQNSTIEKKIQRQILIKSAFNIIIPMNLRVYPNPQLVLQCGQMRVSLKPKFKAIQMNNVVLKFKIVEHNKSSSQGFQQIVNYIMPKIQQKYLARRFNFNMEIQQHQNFDKSKIVIDPIFIEFPPQEYAIPLIQLIYLHIPKTKEVRMKQNRRKQTIGEQFMDAYQNLNDHIAKSIIISSEKQTMKNIMREKKTKQTTIICKGITITDKCFQMLINQININYNYLSFDKIIVSSDNPKKIQLSILNLERMLKHLQEINLQIKKQSMKKGPSNTDTSSNIKQTAFNVQWSQLNVYLNISIKNQQKMVFSLQNISYIQNKQNNSKEMDCIFAVFYDEQIANVATRYSKIPIIQECSISYKQSNKFNLIQKKISFQSLNMNIKPSLFTMLSNLLKNYTLEQTACCIITNQTINTLKIKQSHTNYYNECKYNQKFTTANYYCQMNLFGNKYQLCFNDHKDEIPQHHRQCLKIGKNNFLINKQVSTNHYVLQSNIRIINHQDRTIWLKITQHSSIIINDQEQKPLRYQFNKNMDVNGQLDLTQRIIFDQNLSQSGMSHDAISRKRGLFNSERIFKKSNLSGKNLSIPLKSCQNINILIDENQYNYLQFYDQGKSFTEIKITDIFTNNQIVITTQEQEDQIQYLVIRPVISKQQGIEDFIYTFHIYSPIYIVNRTPWHLEYKISKNQVGDDQFPNNRVNRKKSLELVSLRRVEKLQSEKIRTVLYDQIYVLKLIINTHSREIFSLKAIIQKHKQKHDSSENNFLTLNQLFTLRNNRTQIQMILNIEFSQNILKLRIYPQYVFINMTKDVLRFVIKQNQVSYPQIILGNKKKVRVQHDHYHKNNRRQVSTDNINLYISLTDDKIKERAALKQILQIFEDQFQIHTGEINMQTNKKNIIFRSPQKPFMRSSLKRTQGYFSDNNSQAQYKEQASNNHLLDEQRCFYYLQKKYNIYKRVINIQKYFKLVLFVPTIHIINKSKSIFYVKTSCQNLVKISKEEHNFIHSSDNELYIQAAFQQQEISLNQWMMMKINILGTIYYSKDMITHHASGYQSKQYTLRKKRMKKTPKFFYKILLCKYQRGQKILIEESQYPPYSFINNTKHRIKIQEFQQHFYEELISKGDMGQYSPKNPYHIPFFRLSIAQNYQYKILKQFSGIQKNIYILQNDIILSIEEYKDKIIVIVKQKQEPSNLKISLQYDDIIDKNELLLQEMSKFIIDIKSIHLVVMNKWNRQLNSNVLENTCFIYENKNQKHYYKLSIESVVGYDYMQRQPQYIYKMHQKQNINLLRMEIQYPQQSKTQKTFLNIDLIVNYHKNAVIVEKCNINLAQISFYISADLMLAYAKNYYTIVMKFYSTWKYYTRSKHSTKKKSFLQETFIIESLNWQGTSLKIQSRNLSIMQTFLNKQYQKWVVKFINWLGDIKPIELSSYQVYNQEITLLKLKNKINLKHKMIEVGGLLMDYPKSLLQEFLMLFFRSQQKTIKTTIKTYMKIFKSFQYILAFILDFNDNPISLKESYQQLFIQNEKQNDNLIQKMIKFKYCEWKYSQQSNIHKLNKKIKRLQRYNTRDEIFPYDYEKAFIKIALDIHSNNKLFRKIQHIFKLNSKYIIAVVNQNFILCKLEQRSWLIIKIQYVLSLVFKAEEMVLTFWQEHKGIQQKSNKINSIKIDNVYLEEGDKIDLKRLLKNNILSHYY